MRVKCSIGPLRVHLAKHYLVLDQTQYLKGTCIYPMCRAYKVAPYLKRNFQYLHTCIPKYSNIDFLNFTNRYLVLTQTLKEIRLMEN